MRTRWACPPEKTWTWSAARWASPTASKAAMALRLAARPLSAQGRRGPRSPERTTSRAVAGTPEPAPTRWGT